jgi:hypothetical protein
VGVGGVGIAWWGGGVEGRWGGRGRERERGDGGRWREERGREGDLFHRVAWH